jgi:hypothetical protein
VWCRDGGVLRAYAHAALFAYQRCRRLAKVMCCWELVSQWRQSCSEELQAT